MWTSKLYTKLVMGNLLVELEHVRVEFLVGFFFAKSTQIPFCSSSFLEILNFYLKPQPTKKKI